jgi:putative transposase
MTGAYHQLRVHVSHRAAAGLAGVSRATAHRQAVHGPVRAPRSRRAPVNGLSEAERTQILTVLNSDRFVDTTPIEVFATLLDEGVYLASVATLYRVLRENRQVVERRRLARHPARTRPELIATGPGQVFSWDITKLPGPARGVYYDAYVMIDIYSRYIVGCKIATTESAVLAEDFITGVLAVHGVPQVVHADRGTSMTSKKVADLLADLHVLRSHSRPHVSNDNPYSEAAFKQSNTIRRSRAGSGRSSTPHVLRLVFTWYNHEHHHRDRPAHPRSRPLRSRRRRNRCPATGPGHRLGPESRAIHPPGSTEEPATSRHRLDQQTRTRHRPA